LRKQYYYTIVLQFQNHIM